MVLGRGPGDIDALPEVGEGGVEGRAYAPPGPTAS